MTMVTLGILLLEINLRYSQSMVLDCVLVSTLHAVVVVSYVLSHEVSQTFLRAALRMLELVAVASLWRECHS